jgi:hypothetical protein
MSQAAGSAPAAKKVTVRSFAQAKERGEPIVMVTAYDALFARLVDESGVDSILVGDSLGNVFAGLETTVPVTLDQMIYHGLAARRGTSRALLVVDLPFLTYQVSTERALLNAGRVMQETRCDAVKLEGGSEETCDTVRALVRAGIPVVGHLGFTPQSVHVLGGFRVQGRGDDAADRMLAGRAATPGRGRVRARAGARARSPRGARDGGVGGPHDRHRRRVGMRRAGARAAGSARTDRPVHTQVPAALCDARRHHARGGATLRRRGARARVPGRRARILTRRRVDAC